MSVISKYRIQIENALKTLNEEKKPTGLYTPVDYILSLGGKRLRPAFCLAGCALFNEQMVNHCLPAALSMEVFHNFTLLHDDIMDQSPIRRNQPTVHKKWNDNTAILSGDAMVILAYQLLAQSPSEKLPQILEVFNQTALEVCEGQQYDMDFETRNDVKEEEYLEMIRLKTAVLLGGSLKIGAIIGGAPANDAQLLYDFGVNIGLSFQLQDDWLDVFGDEAEFGKPIGGDILNNKKTYLLIKALNNLPGQQKSELENWCAQKKFDKQEKISSVRNLYKVANVSEQTKKIMNYYFERSIESLNKINGSDLIKEELIQQAHQMITRSR
ncbi:polyprenyl synthetase family protein [Geofilum sp. OHC36d9]|uniref:polyprenyl synthetase family protein n=1 Tax=Geofilum sp. OHC36d9 TaxID=3458413 RepID=UPI00403464BA